MGSVALLPVTFFILSLEVSRSSPRGLIDAQEAFPSATKAYGSGTVSPVTPTMCVPVPFDSGGLSWSTNDYPPCSSAVIYTTTFGFLTQLWWPDPSRGFVGQSSSALTESWAINDASVGQSGCNFATSALIYYDVVSRVRVLCKSLFSLRNGVHLLWSCR